MPHAGLMDERKLPPEEGLLLRARLHIRGGKRRLRQDKIAAGIVTLYDALIAAMEWYVSSPERRRRFALPEGGVPGDDKQLYDLLVRSRVFDGSFDYRAFDLLVEDALLRELPGYDYTRLTNDLDDLMTRLGVMPFDETTLPPEDPSTY